MADSFSLPNQAIKRPEFDEALTLEKARDYLRDIATAAEDNFKAVKNASFAQGSSWQIQPQARVYNSASIGIADSTPTALTFDSERYDQGASSEQHSTSSNPGRLTCNRPGLYAIGANVSFQTSSAGERYVGLRLDGSTFIGLEQVGAGSGSSATALNVSADYRLAVGQYVEVVVYQSSGALLNVEALGNFSPEFYWHLVSP